MSELDPEYVAAVSAAAGVNVNDEQVAAVLAALGLLEEGEAVGTRKEHENGDFAVRVLRNGRPVWWVIPANGDKPYRNAEPVLGEGWTAV